MLRIGEFTDTFYPIVDGVGRVVYNYALQICQKGHECYVVAPMTDTGYLGGKPYELIEFVSVDLPMQRQYQTGIPLSDAHYLRKIQQVNLDIIHVHSPFIAGTEALRLAKKRKIPVIGEFHSKYYDDFYQYTKAAMLANLGVKMIVDFYSRCDEVWTVSNSSAETLYDYGFKGDIVVIPNGTPDVNLDTDRREAAKKLFNLTGEKPILMYCGQMNWKKNILRILESLALLKQKGYDFDFVMVGQGLDAKAIQSKAEELGLMENMVFTGHIHEDAIINGLYEAADLFIFPSLYDTSGLVVREAAALATPSVVVRGSAPAEIIEDKENGLLCEDTTESLASVIQKVFDNPELSRLLGENAKSTIFLPWSKVIDMSLNRYQMLIEKKKQTYSSD